MNTRIRDYRKRRAFTLQQLAERVGTTAQTIQRLETDNMTVSIDWLSRIAKALGVTPGELLGEAGRRRIRCICDIGEDGVIAPAAGFADGSVHIEIDVPGEDPVAIRLRGQLGPYELGTILIADRLESIDLRRADGRDCLVSLRSGDLLFRRIVCNGSGPTAYVPYSDSAAVERDLDIAWVAPVVMSLRYAAGYQP